MWRGCGGGEGMHFATEHPSIMETNEGRTKNQNKTKQNISKQNKQQ
jgi:hypothetical protein